MAAPRDGDGAGPAHAATANGAKTTPFANVFEEAGALLPKQGTLTHFVHHNPWEMLQHMTWDDALAHVHAVSCYMSPGDRSVRSAYRNG